jgi:alkylation response protein AidB-like acyl-CoA dehydrogenase
MDFTLTENQQMVRDLARGILDKEMTVERLKRVEADSEWFDRDLWSTLAEAGLLGLAVDEEFGGMGLGFEEICLFLGEIGRAVAPVPVLPSLLLGGLPIAEFGSPAQKKEWLPLLAAGDAILSAALVDDEAAYSGNVVTRARKEGSSWILDGRKNCVPAAHIARCILVPATAGNDVIIFLVDPKAEGVALLRQETSTGEPLFSLQLSGVRVGEGAVLGGEEAPAEDRLAWIYERALVAVAATQTGVSEKALEITAGYVREREQFGVPIGSFQAVQHRAADGYIDLEAMRWVTWRAAWKLSNGLPAGRDAAVAKFWAADGGARIAASAQHLHGGIGVDMDYPIHRYFLWSKQLELGLGAATPQLARLGRDMARTGPQELT